MRDINIENLKAKYKIVGRDARLDRALDTAIQVAHTDLSVLIQGESGVGKEVIPRIIHDHSPRKTKRYIAINCGSIPEGTIDSELFGHEKGSFTGAIGDHDGYFGAADGGTLFLDEVGELPLSTQARLLRVLETGEYIRVGSNQPRKTNVRIVAATNVNMPRAIREGRFREDLYFRLCTISIKMPPLRDRGDDVVLLFKKFAYDTADKYQIPTPLRLTPEAEDVLRSYKWPGNIRQLRNLVEQMNILCSDERIVTPEMLAEYDIWPGSHSTEMATIPGNARDEQSGYEKERPIIFAMLNKINSEIEELRQRFAAAVHSSLIDLQNDSFAKSQPIGLPVTPLLAPPDEAAVVPSVEIASSDVNTKPGTAYTESGRPVVAGAGSMAPVVDEEAELIEERQDLNLLNVERRAIEEALRRNQFRRNLAATDLGISERTLYRKIRDYGIDIAK